MYIGDVRSFGANLRVSDVTSFDFFFPQMLTLGRRDRL